MSTVPQKEELKRKFEDFVQEIDLTGFAKGQVDIAWEYAEEEYALWPLAITAPMELKYQGEIAFTGEGLGDLLEQNGDGELIVTENDLGEAKKLLLSQADDIANQLHVKLSLREEDIRQAEE